MGSCKLPLTWEELHNNIGGYDEETEWIYQSFLKNSKIESILELACGVGNHLMLLAKKGYTCIGIDASEKKINVAKSSVSRSNLTIQFSVGDMRSIDFGDHKFDLVLSLYAVSQLVQESDLLAFLNSVTKALNDGGYLLFNVINKDFELLDGGRSFTSPAFENAHLRFHSDETLVSLLKNFNLISQRILFKDVKGARKYDMFLLARSEKPKQ